MIKSKTAQCYYYNGPFYTPFNNAVRKSDGYEVVIEYQGAGEVRLVPEMIPTRSASHRPNYEPTMNIIHSMEMYPDTA